MEGNETGAKAPIINELLCFIQNKIDILELDIIIQLCEERFDKTTIEKSKEMLFDLCHSETDKTMRRGCTGEHKSGRNLQDIYNLLQEKGENAPTFCAKFKYSSPSVIEWCGRVQPAAHYYTVADRNYITPHKLQNYRRSLLIMSLT